MVLFICPIFSFLGLAATLRTEKQGKHTPRLHCFSETSDQIWEDKKVHIKLPYPLAPDGSKLTPHHQGIKMGLRLVHSQLG